MSVQTPWFGLHIGPIIQIALVVLVIVLLVAFVNQVRRGRR